MKTVRLSVVVTMAILASNYALADDSSYFNDRAEVLSSTPVYHQVNHPRRECWTDDSQSNNSDNNSGSTDHSYLGAGLGAIAGGLLGNQVGGGNGRTAATAVGAVAGALVGDHLGNQNQNQPAQPTQHCETHDNYQQVLDGYAVTYRYHGQTMSTQMPQDPGRYLNLIVHVVPASEQQWQSQGNQGNN